MQRPAKPRLAERERRQLADRGQGNAPGAYRLVDGTAGDGAEVGGPAQIGDHLEHSLRVFDERGELHGQDVHGESVEPRQIPGSEAVADDGAFQHLLAEQGRELSPALAEPHHGGGTGPVLAKEHDEQGSVPARFQGLDARGQRRVPVCVVRDVDEDGGRNGATDPPQCLLEAPGRAVVERLLDLRGFESAVAREDRVEERAARAAGADAEQVFVRGAVRGHGEGSREKRPVRYIEYMMHPVGRYVRSSGGCVAECNGFPGGFAKARTAARAAVPDRRPASAPPLPPAPVSA